MVALELTVAQVNSILAVLGDRPYREVYELIETIHRQAAPQLRSPAEGEPDREPNDELAPGR